MKYIILEGKHDIPEPIIFSDTIEHKDEANGREVISAGFVEFKEDGTVICDGWSKSLNINSKPGDDAEIINRCIRMSRY